jgi:hypothetical protein
VNGDLKIIKDGGLTKERFDGIDQTSVLVFHMECIIGDIGFIFIVEGFQVTKKPTCSRLLNESLQ